MLRTRIVPSKPALLLEGARKSLVITDIHIGFEGAMAANEIRIGKKSTIGETISEVTGIIDSERPDSVILLGDVKSSVRGIAGAEWDEVPEFLSEIGRRCDVTLVPGNHDAGIQRLVPDGVSMTGASGMVEENVLLTHGHAMPSERFSHVDRIVMGHLHPVFLDEDSVMNGQRVWVSLQADRGAIFPDRRGSIEITVVPSFNRYFYATHRRRHEKSISPIIDRVREVSSARIVTLDGTIIGDESMIDRVI